MTSQSIEPVALWQFVVATLFIFPKLALHVFIGSRIAALSDGDQRDHMDTRMMVSPLVAIFAHISHHRHENPQWHFRCGWTYRRRPIGMVYTLSILGTLSRSHIPAQDYIQFRPETHSPLGGHIP